MKVLNGNNIELLKQYPDNYFDAIVTDPPYGLGKEPDCAEMLKAWLEVGYMEVKGSGFMGKEWDAFVPQPIFWKEVFRVLKHGGHVLSFFGTRTYDWGVMAMRLAGFEVRDCIQWLYGSGFPKSHNISKAIDKQDTNDFKKIVGLTIKKHRNKCGFTMDELCNKLKLNNQGHGGMVNHYENGRATPTIEIWKDLCDILKIKEIKDYEIQKNGRLKEIAEVENPISWFGNGIIKESTTEQAKQWDGWGSALKPANEPIVLARKPLEKGLSIAENVLKWGTGAINIDGCRIETNEKIENHSRGGESAISKGKYGDSKEQETHQTEGQKLGRFPANIILTHHPECECLGIKEEIENWNCHPDCPIKILDEQSGELKSGNLKSDSYAKDRENDSIFAGGGKFTHKGYSADKGGASRFFYVAKASKSERNKGLEGFEEKQMAWSNQAKAELKRGNTEFSDDTKMHNKVQSRVNFHPTVKPIKLMQYLARLITPPNGIVLDPFCGSGTTGIACKLEGFDFVGMEQDPEYTKIAQARIDNYADDKQKSKTTTETENDEPTEKTFTQTSLF